MPGKPTINSHLISYFFRLSLIPKWNSVPQYLLSSNNTQSFSTVAGKKNIIIFYITENFASCKALPQIISSSQQYCDLDIISPYFSQQGLNCLPKIIQPALIGQCQQTSLWVLKPTLKIIKHTNENNIQDIFTCICINNIHII